MIISIFINKNKKFILRRNTYYEDFKTCACKSVLFELKKY